MVIPFFFFFFFFFFLPAHVATEWEAVLAVAVTRVSTYDLLFVLVCRGGSGTALARLRRFFILWKSGSSRALFPSRLLV